MRSKGEQEQLSKNRMAFQAWFVLVWIILIPIKIFTIKGRYAFITQALLGSFLVFLIYQLFRLRKAMNVSPKADR